MKKLLLGVLVLALVAIPLAVAADTVNAEVDVCTGGTTVTFPSSYDLGTLPIPGSGSACGNMVVDTCDYTSWYVTMKDGFCPTATHPGHMYTPTPTDRWLTNPLLIDNWAGGAGDLEDSCTAAVTVWNEGGTGSHTQEECILQTTTTSDYGGAYSLPIVFTFVGVS
jgi:hypothetical protein